MKATSKPASNPHTTGTKPKTRSSRGPSKRKQTEEALREYQSILAAAEEVAKIGSWKWDLQTQKVTWSDEMFHLFGVEREGFDGDVNRIIAERIHPDDVAAVDESNRKVLEEANPIPLSYRILLPDGTERTVWAQGKLIHDEEGQPQALTGFIQDITERVRAEKKIVQLKRLYATLSQVNQMIVRVKERDDLFQTICDIAVKFGEFSVAWLGLLDEDSGDVPPRFASGMDLENWPLPIVNIHTGPLANGLVSRALHTSNVTISEDPQADRNLKVLHDPLRKHGFHSSAVIPIHQRDKAIGTLTLLSEERELFRDMEEVHLLEEMGLDISFALDNMENEKERKQVQQSLCESEERLRLSLLAANQGLYDLNVQTGTAIVNRQYAEMLGYDPDTFTETNAAWVERLHPDDQERVAQIYLDYVHGLLPEYRVEFRQRMRDGKWKWILSLGKVIEYDFDRNPLRMLGTHTDIDERKQAEEALKRNERILRLFVEHSPASIAMFDRNMIYIVASRRYLIDYDLPLQDLTGRSHYEVFPEIPDHWKEIHQRCLQGAIEKAEEELLQRANGKLDWVRWEIHPWYEKTGTIGGIILFSEVITERKRIQDEVRLLNLHLEQRVIERTLELSQANRAKDEFLANMSHELRTPLNTVLGLSESLLEQRRGPLNEKQIQSIEMIAASGQHLLGLINDILEVSKIDAGKLQLHPGMVPLKELCESSLNFIKEPALKKSIIVEFRNETSISTFRADPQRLKQILINLLTNAVKFTPERGIIQLHVSTTDEMDQVLFSVMDTGVGIETEDLKKLFTPFTQLDSSLARQYAGTGLGLTLVQKLTELHGGSVHVESEPGLGSRFTIHLPLFQNIKEPTLADDQFEPARIERNPASTTKGGSTILLADDNEINSTMVKEFLETRGYNVLVAQDGEEVLDKAMEFAPDIILMDIQMPKMDGLEATRHLRENPRFVSTPIIALTALAMPGDKEHCLEAGANEYLSKPVSLKLLQKIIESLLGM